MTEYKNIRTELFISEETYKKLPRVEQMECQAISDTETNEPSSLRDILYRVHRNAGRSQVWTPPPTFLSDIEAEPMQSIETTGFRPINFDLGEEL